MSTTASSTNHERRQNRCRFLVVMLVLCSTLFVSIGSIARAQEKPGFCPEGQVYDETTATCVEAPPAEEDSEATGSLTVSSYICDSDFDAASASTADYFNDCGFPGDGIAFNVTEADGTGASGTTNSNGYLGIEDLNLDAVSVTQTVPGGYSTPFVACAAGDGNTDYIAMPVNNGSSIDLDFAAASYYVCVWFNIGIPIYIDVSTEPVAIIGITTWKCPNGFVSATGDQNDYFDHCQLIRLPGVAFTLVNAAGTEVGTGSTDANGKLAFPGLAPDRYTIAETFPAGYESSAAFCGYYDAMGSGDFFFETETVINGAFTHLMNAGDTLVCDIYSIQTPTPTGITVSKYVCDPATSALPGVNSMNSTELQAICLADPSPYNFEFQLSDTLGASEYEIVGAEIPGRVRFDKYTPGQVTIYETFPAGFSPPLVFCGVVPPGAVQPLALNPIKVLGSFIVLDAPAGDEIQCGWFNFQTQTADGLSLDPNKPVPGLVPIGAPSSSDTLDPDDTIDRAGQPQLNVFPRGCPEGFNPVGRNYVAFRDACTELQDGIQFSLIGDNGYSSEATTSIASAGAVLFYGLVDDQYSLTEIFPAGYGSAHVFCGITIQADQAPTPLTSTSDQPDRGSYSFAFVQGPNPEVIFNCQIFNVRFGDNAVPAEEGAADLAVVGGTVDVYTWACPVNYDAGTAAQSDLIADCTTVMSNISFSIATADGELATGISGVDGPGMASFDGISGDVSVTEILPAGYGTPVVYCGAESGEASIVAVTDGAMFTLSVTETEQWSCDVFNTRAAL